MSSAESTPKSNTASAPPRIPRVLVDADVLVAGAFSTTGASHLILKLGESTILECIAPLQVKEEAERNLRYKMPDALDMFRALIRQALTIVDDPPAEAVSRFLPQAHPEDAPILAAAALNDCPYLLTFNKRHYYPDKRTSVTVLTPGEFLQRLRAVIGQLVQPETKGE